MASVFPILKGVNRPITFKGLKAQYIAYLAAGLVVLLIGFAAGYVLGVTLFVLVPGVLLLGGLLFTVVMRLSRRFGEYGLLKYFARRSLPRGLVFRSRHLFVGLKHLRS